MKDLHQKVVEERGEGVEQGFSPAVKFQGSGL
jgi:hypothetical protein